MKCLLLLLIVLGAACGPGEPASRSPVESPSSTPNGEDLIGHTYVATSVTEDGDERGLVAGTELSVGFHREGDRLVLRWGAGCNPHGADVEIAPRRLRTGEMAGTAIGCPGELADQDEWLAGFFRTDPEWILTGDELTLASGDVVISLERSGEPAPSPSVESPSPTPNGEDLIGHTYVATSVTEDGDERGLVAGTELSVNFYRDGNRVILGWEAGCNSHGAPVRIAPRRLRVGEMAGTLIGCPDELADQDEWLAGFFRSDPEWVLAGDQLTLTSNDVIISLERSR